MIFEFATAGRVMFGPGVLRQLSAAQFGRRAFVVGGRNVERLAPLLDVLKKAAVEFVTLATPGEPTIDLVCKGVAAARESGCDFVIGFGGGSAIDAAKAIAALMTNPGEVLDYLEVIGHAKPLVNSSLSFVAIPTTAGAGAEVTRNAVLASPEHKVKVSLRSPLMLARLALVDPEFTLDLPRALTASTGMDALTQLIEPYVSIRANALTDALCVEGIPRAARALRRAWNQPADIEARTDMSLAALFSGVTLANAGLGAVHGFAAAIGGMFPAPHGAICAALLSHAMEINIRALGERLPNSQALARYGEVARLLTGEPQAEAADGIEFVRQLCSDLQIPRLGSYGISAADIPAICEKAAVASSMKANPLLLTNAELREILERAI